MRFFLVLLMAAVLMSGCVSQRTIAVRDLQSLQGKSIAVTVRQRPPLRAGTAGKMLAGAVGAIAMAAAGNKIVAENGIGDPATAMTKDLLQAAESHYGVTAEPGAGINVDTTDVPALARAARGVDLLLDVQLYEQYFEFFFPTNLTHYSVGISIHVRLINVRDRRLIGEGHCLKSTRDDPNPPTRNELLVNKAALLKSMLDAQTAACTAQFKADVLKITG